MTTVFCLSQSGITVVIALRLKVSPIRGVRTRLSSLRSTLGPLEKFFRVQPSFRWQAAHKLEPRRSTLGRQSPSPLAPEWWEATKRVFDKGTEHTKRGAANKQLLYPINHLLYITPCWASALPLSVRDNCSFASDPKNPPIRGVRIRVVIRERHRTSHLGGKPVSIHLFIRTGPAPNVASCHRMRSVHRSTNGACSPFSTQVAHSPSKCLTRVRARTNMKAAKLQDCRTSATTVVRSDVARKPAQLHLLGLCSQKGIVG